MNTGKPESVSADKLKDLIDYLEKVERSVGANHLRVIDVRKVQEIRVILTALQHA